MKKENMSQKENQEGEIEFFEISEIAKISTKSEERMIIEVMPDGRRVWIDGNEITKEDAMYIIKCLLKTYSRHYLKEKIDIAFIRE